MSAERRALGNIPAVLLLDVDGVVLDSNRLKQANIVEASLPVVGAERAERLRHDFVTNSGYPREGKIAAVLGQGTAEYHEVLSRYNALNQTSLVNVPFTEGALEVLQRLAETYRLVALSGADEKELHGVFAFRGIAALFYAIRGGPLTKLRNLRCFESEPVSLFVGDARADVEVARAARLPFCFMSGYTEWSDWRNELERARASGWTPVACIQTLTELPPLLSSLTPQRLQPITGSDA